MQITRPGLLCEQERDRRSEKSCTHFTGLVLCDLVLCVFFAVLALAIGAASLRDVDLESYLN